MDAFSEVLANEIRPGEQVLWREQPVPELIFKGTVKRSRQITARLYLIAVILFVFFACGNYHTADGVSFFASVIGALVCSVGLGVALWRGLRTFNYAKTYLYVITDKRLILISLRPKVTVMSFSRAAVINNNYSKTYNADGSGDIVFKGEKVVILRGLKDIKTVSALIDSLNEGGMETARPEQPLVS